MLSNAAVASVVSEFFTVFLVEIIDQKIIQKAIALVDKYRYSYFDCLILSSALVSDCSILYSEDMYHLHTIENSLKIINPFHHVK
jgi:predicted nucleic acid-binding protein